MNIETLSEGIRVIERARVMDYRASLATDARHGLALDQKELPPKYFYDERGSLLFEAICELPEYYQTRTERSILEHYAGELVARYQPGALVEFGSGSSAKTRILLDAMSASGSLRRYVPIDISREILLRAAEDIVREYPELLVDAVIADFNEPLGLEAVDERALIIFLGGTIGNFRRPDAVAFLRGVASSMRPGDLFLLGIDLVKEPAIINPAYNDAAGVTAEFNLNVLHVLNRELDAAFDVDAFAHYAFFNPTESQIEMHAVSLRDQSVRIEALDMAVQFARGETILTEISRKFTHAAARSMLFEAGLEPVETRTDPAGLFSLCLAQRAG